MRHAIATVTLLVGCTPGTDDAQDLRDFTERPGDPDAGYDALVNEGYVKCGIPTSVYDRFFGATSPGNRIPGRTGANADLPYFFTQTTADSGADVVGANCLACHAGWLNGELVIGLGDHQSDFTTDPSLPAQMVAAYVEDGPDREAYEEWRDRVVTTAPYLLTDTVGVNPADNLAGILFAHRDPQTLEWHDEPLLEPPPLLAVPLDVPPWWWMKKKSSMFYSAAGRGDHARIMMTASALCTDSVEEAEQIDGYFPDISAYIDSIEAPEWPWEVDDALAEDGRTLFEANCSECHGTYGSDGSYPNRVVHYTEIGTDPVLVIGATQFADRFVDWFNDSFYGEIAYVEPQEGFIAPPLDGVWASAPYFHNGSVPTVDAVLDSTSRPTYWTRSFSSVDYSRDHVGWNWQPTGSKVDELNQDLKKAIYDTTKLGFDNGGHTYGDVLSDAERAAVIEYLKTL